MNNLTPYEFLRRVLTDERLIQASQAIRNDTPGTLEQLGITDEKEKKEFKQIFDLMCSGAALQTEQGKHLALQQQTQQKEIAKSMSETLAVAKEMKEGLKRTLEQIDRAYRSTMLMYQVSFYLGVLLIIVAVGTALYGRETLLSAVFGSLGIADLLAFFLVKPQERLQASRSSLAQVQAAMYNWFMDSVNLNTLMSRYDQSGDLKAAAAVSETLLLHTDKTLEMLQKYCKLSVS